MYTLQMYSIGALVATVAFSLGLSAQAFEPGDVEGIWLFDENSGVVVKDASGNGRDGEVQGADRVDGVFGKALQFDGSAATGVIVTDYKGVDGNDPRTTMLWWKSEKGDNRDHSWVKWGINANAAKYYVRAHVEGADCTLRVETQGGQHYGLTNVCDGEWHHLAVVFPPGSDNVKDHLLYVDGVEEADTAGNPVGVDTNTQTQDVVFGIPLAHHVHANGMMDEVAIFNVAVDEATIQQIYEQGFEAALSVDAGGKLPVAWGRIKAHR